LKSRTLLTSRWWATQWLPSHPAYTRLCTLLSIPFSEKSRGAQTTGHYLRTVTPDIKADNHDQMQQIAQSTVTNTIGTAIAELASSRDVNPGEQKMNDSFASQCDYCRSSIASGQRWVREKIYNSALNRRDPSYHCYHAEPFEGQEGSCWEKHEMEREIVRTTAYAA
jgi:hypothetical protein